MVGDGAAGVAKEHSTLPWPQGESIYVLNLIFSFIPLLFRNVVRACELLLSKYSTSAGCCGAKATSYHILITFQPSYCLFAQVISCDIRAVLTELLHSVVASSASMDMGEDAEDMLAPPAGDSLASFSPHLGRKRSPSGASSIASESQVSGGTVLGDSTLNYYLNKQLPAALPDSAMFANMNSLPFEEFLALFVEQVADHGETNMCYAFYKEFIADGSVVFKDLLTRHSSVLDRWSI